MKKFEMARNVIRITFLLTAIAVGQVMSNPVRVEALTVTSVDRSIDIASQLVHVTTKMKIENTNASPAKYFLFSIEPFMKARLSFIGATTNGGKTTLKTAIGNMEKPIPAADGALIYRINFPTDLTKGKVFDVDVETVFTRYLEPFPVEITQKEKQLIKFLGNHYFYTPYTTTKQTTKMVLASKNVEAFTKLKPSSQADNTLSFGPYENIVPFSISECAVHGENNSPFLTITQMERTIEVSHWGNIAVEEHIEILHTGAKLKNSFSRFDFQREQNSGISSVKAFKTVLPASARDVYYRDDIGNISTSNMQLRHDSVDLILRPRFPLFGGWKTRYVIGYNLPSYEYLYTQGSQYVLKMRILDHVYDTMAVDDFTVKIILPEGSSDLKLKLAYPLKELPRTLHYTYLDITGRPVITLTGKNLVENHIQDFELEYNFPKLYMLREPLVIIAAFLILFFTVLIYVRLDFSISPGKVSKGSGANSTAVENVLKRHAKRVNIYETFDSHLNKLKTNKDVSGYQNVLKTMTSEHKVETTAINELMTQNKTEFPTFSENVLELQRLDRGLWEVYVQLGQNVEKMASGKMNRQLFVDQENSSQKKKDELAEKINQIIKNL